LIDYFKVNIESEADIVILEYKLKKHLEKNFINLPKALVVARELSTNILKYGTKGYVEFKLFSDKLIIIAFDYGIKRQSFEGLSISKGLGIGLKVVKNNSDDFTMEKNEYGGIVATAVINLNKKQKKFGIHFGISVKPHYLEEKSGDIVLIKEILLDKYLILMADVLGHGIKAYEVAQKIKNFFLSYEYKNLEDFYIKLEMAIEGTRGCALFLGVLSEFELEYINVGNIRGWFVNKNNIKKLMSSPGVVGRHQGYYKVYKERAVMHDAFIILCSDGISSRFSPSVLAYKEDVQLMADKIIKDYGIDNDDASVLIIRGD